MPSDLQRRMELLWLNDASERASIRKNEPYRHHSSGHVSRFADVNDVTSDHRTGDGPEHRDVTRDGGDCDRSAIVPDESLDLSFDGEVLCRPNLTAYRHRRSKLHHDGSDSLI